MSQPKLLLVNTVERLLKQILNLERCATVLAFDPETIRYDGSVLGSAANDEMRDEIRDRNV